MPNAVHGLGVVVAAVMMTIAGCSAEPGPRAGRTTTVSVPAGGGPTADPNEPTRRLTGTPLTGTTRLGFLVAADPPVVLDTDRDELRPLEGFPRGRGRVVAVWPIPGTERVLLESSCDGCEASDLFVVGPGAAGLEKIGTGTAAVPSLDGRGVWVSDHRDRSRCTLTRLSLDGRTRMAPRRISCGRMLVAETPLGLHWRGLDEGTAEVIEPSGGGAEVLRAHQILAVVGRQVLSDDGTSAAFTLTDVGTGRRTPVPKPTAIGGPGPGLLAPDGRTVALSFEHPAWPGPRQRMDTWVLDLPTLRWRQVPAMPVHASLKRSGMAWTDDGRLVLLGRFDGVGDALALWRVGDGRLAVRKVGLPRDGADGFVPLKAG
jgi:hypothetical protein